MEVPCYYLEELHRRHKKCRKAMVQQILGAVKGKFSSLSL